MKVMKEKGCALTGGGITFGACLAIVISYVTWGSIWWAILHGLFGWIYVIYFLLIHA